MGKDTVLHFIRRWQHGTGDMEKSRMFYLVASESCSFDETFTQAYCFEILQFLGFKFFSVDLHMINTSFSICKTLRFWMSISIMWKTRLKLPHSLKVSSKLKLINNSVHTFWLLFHWRPKIQRYDTKIYITRPVTCWIFLLSLKEQGPSFSIFKVSFS